MSESIRDRIVRALTAADVLCSCEDSGEATERAVNALLFEFPALRAIRDCDTAHEQIVLTIVGACDVGSHYAADAADEIVALFPILAGMTDEAVEAGARALHDRYNIEWGDPCQFDELPPTAQELLRGDARVVLGAALGKEQVGERG